MKREDSSDIRAITSLVGFIVFLIAALVRLLQGDERPTATPTKPSTERPTNDLSYFATQLERCRNMAGVTLTQFGVPDWPPNAELARMRVRGGARKWQFMARGYSHDSLSGPVPRWRLYMMLKEDDGLRFVRHEEDEFDKNAIFMVPEDGQLKGVDVGFIPREFAAQFAPLLDGGAWFFSKVQRILADGEGNGFPKMFVYARMVKPPLAAGTATQAQPQ